jgi:gamma-glutamylcyclotransferase (GGCT)/AIG2-like uncharacterized protein YtfP
MPEKINKVFVYGTLLQGEFRNPHMSDCRLLGTLEIPGALYDTGRGYPAMVFDDKSDKSVCGELYLMSNPVTKINELDVVEMIEAGLFNRVELSYGGTDFYTYEAGLQLSECLIPQNKITEGNWRRYSSLLFHDPLSFATNFENRQKLLYREPADSDSDGLIYIKGDIPILVSAPHSSVHKRMGKLKRQEYYTAALSVMLHSLAGCHVLYTNRLMETDPNYYDESPFKNKLNEIADSNHIKLLIDLHGTGRERRYDLYPGVGNEREFLLGCDNYLDELQKRAGSSNISVGGLDVFPAAKQMTVTKYAARKLNIPSIQLEINRNLREPDKKPGDFMRLVKFLGDLIDGLTYLLG